MTRCIGYSLPYSTPLPQFILYPFTHGGETDSCGLYPQLFCSLASGRVCPMEGKVRRSKGRGDRSWVIPPPFWVIWHFSGCTAIPLIDCGSPSCADPHYVNLPSVQAPFPWELPFVWEPLPMGVPSCGKPPSVGTLLLCKPPFCARPPPSVGALFLWKAPSCGRLHSSSRRTRATPVPSLGPFGPREVTASHHCQPLEKSLNQILKIPVTMSSISCWALIAGIPPRLTII